MDSLRSPKINNRWSMDGFFNFMLYFHGYENNICKVQNSTGFPINDVGIKIFFWKIINVGS